MVIVAFVVFVVIGLGTSLVMMFGVNELTKSISSGDISGLVKNLTDDADLIASGFRDEGEESAAVSGDPISFDPVASLPEVKEFSGEGSKLLSIDAMYVRSDGTLDLTATSYRPTVDYEFYRETAAPEDAPPIGAGGSIERKWYETVTVSVYRPGETRHVTSMGGGINKSYYYTNKGMDRSVDGPTGVVPGVELAEPKCSFADLWKVALEEGAAEDAVAMIEYTEDGYDFSISGLDINLEFDAECTLL